MSIKNAKTSERGSSSDDVRTSDQMAIKEKWQIVKKKKH